MEAASAKTLLSGNFLMQLMFCVAYQWMDEESSVDRVQRQMESEDET